MKIKAVISNLLDSVKSASFVFVVIICFSMCNESVIAFNNCAISYPPTPHCFISTSILFYPPTPQSVTVNTSTSK